LIKPPRPEREKERIEALRSCAILDTQPEETFEDAVKIASYVCGTPIALVSLVDEQRQWFKARIGLDVPETSRDVSFCAHTLQDATTMVVPDTFADVRFVDNPLVTGDPFIRFYAGAPLTIDGGNVLGTLCVADREVRELEPHQLEILESLSRIVSRELQLRREGLSQRERRERFEGFLHSLGDGVVAVDSHGSVTFVDHTAQGILSRSEADLVGRDWEEILGNTPEMAASFISLLAEPGSGPETVSLSPSGRIVEARSATVPDDECSILLLLRDVTDVERLREYGRLRHASLGFVGVSPAVHDVVKQIQRVGAVNLPVLFVGETGTGKELAARGLHQVSTGGDKPFVAINCAALSESLLGSQLFGHRRGAFTGAVGDQKGLFEAAAGGTVFLDEIGDMPLALQASLLRVLETGEVVRLGESQAKSVAFRLVCATNRDLESMVRTGSFREDLYYRIRGLKVALPPLRERRQDVPVLVQHFADLAAAENRAEPVTFDHEVVAALMEHDWPGNVRELRNVVHFAVLHCDGPTIRMRDLPPDWCARRPQAASAPGGSPAEDITRALELSGGNRTKAARLLGISRATFYRHLQKLDMSSG
jgi:transcriptional regulator with PAS, ATPase and Fis domain